MQGQFLFSTCNRAGLSMRALLRNTARENSGAQNQSDMDVRLNVFHEGLLEYECAKFAAVRPDGYAEVSAQTCPILNDETRDFLLVAHCTRGSDTGYFAQEHQVIYESRQDGRTTSLLYDQMPVPAGKPKLNSILLLAPKVWISNDVDTFITLANVGGYEPSRVSGSRWQMDFLGQDGKKIHSIAADLAQNASHVIDVKETLAGRLEPTGELKLLTVVARGETAMCAILTFLRNRRTCALALEHSLSPHYYMNGDFARVRKEAFLLSDARGGG